MSDWLKRWRVQRLALLEADLSDWRSALIVRESYGGGARAALRARKAIERLESRVSGLQRKLQEVHRAN